MAQQRDMKKFELWNKQMQQNAERMNDYNEKRVVEVLEKKAKTENWICEKHIGSDTGVDLKLQRDERIIFIEAKGEREKQKNVKQPVENALGAIIMSLKEDNLENEYFYCIAFPDTVNFRKIVDRIPPRYLRALRINVFLVDCPKELIKFRRFDSTDDVLLNSFSDLF